MLVVTGIGVLYGDLDSEIDGTCPVGGGGTVEYDDGRYGRRDVYLNSSSYSSGMSSMFVSKSYFKWP